MTLSTSAFHLPDRLSAKAVPILIADDEQHFAAVATSLSKGLEFDLVVLVDPEAFGTGIERAVDRYVAMARATRQLVVLTGS